MARCARSGIHDWCGQRCSARTAPLTSGLGMCLLTPAE
jgi:hypothetical protein